MSKKSLINVRLKNYLTKNEVEISNAQIYLKIEKPFFTFFFPVEMSNDDKVM